MSSIIVLLAVTRLQQTTDVAADMAPTGFVSFSGASLYKENPWERFCEAVLNLD